MYQLFDFAYFRDFETSIQKLAGMAMAEPWSFSNEPTNSFSILKNYLEHTFRRLKFEDKIKKSSDNQSVCFNTGLMTPNYSYIFAFFETNKNTGATNPYFFKAFFSESDLSFVKHFSELPDPAYFFADPSLFVYNHILPIQLNVDHIVDDNIDRFPQNIKDNRDMCRRLLSGAIEETKKRLRANYKIAVPHCYDNKVQLLIPIYLTGSFDTPDLALAIEKNRDRYYAITCLTMRMAYQNARLIVKPESSWLHA